MQTVRKNQAFLLKQPKNIRVPSERTVYRIMEKIDLNHRPNRKLNGIIKTD